MSQRDRRDRRQFSRGRESRPRDEVKTQPQCMNINKIIDKTATSRDFAVLFKQYLKEYPRTSAGTIAKTLWKSPSREFTKYFGPMKDSALEALVEEHKDAMAIRYVEHLLSNQLRLDAVSVAVYGDHLDGMTIERYAEFDEPTLLKNEVQEFIKARHVTSVSSIPHILLTNGEAELFHVLVPELKFGTEHDPCRKVENDGVEINDPWHPLHLPLSFHHFQRTVHAFITFPPPNTKPMEEWVVEEDFRHIPTLRKHYILYIHQVTYSNYEFLLAIVSAFGTEASEYPSALLELMRKRRMLVEFPNLVVQNQNQQNTKSFDPPPIVTRDDLGEVSHRRGVPKAVDIDDLTKKFKKLMPSQLPVTLGFQATEELEELLQRYVQKYPTHSTSTLEKTFWKSTLNDLNRYSDELVEKNSPTHISFRDTFATEYMQHLLRYQEQLDEISRSIYYDHVRKNTINVAAQFDKSTPLKEKVLKWFATFGKRPKSCTCQVQLRSGQSELQAILSENYQSTEESSPDINFDNPYEDPWHPIHLSFSFHQFQRTVNTYIFGPPTNEKFNSRVVCDRVRHLPTYYKYYMEHMNEVAVSDHEFLLAVVCTYGTEASQYPSTVLSFMDARDLLRDLANPEKNHLQTKSKVVVTANNPSSVSASPVSKSKVEQSGRTQKSLIKNEPNPWSFLLEEPNESNPDLQPRQTKFLDDLSTRLIKSQNRNDIIFVADEFECLFDEEGMNEKLELIEGALLDNLPQLVVTVENVTETIGIFLTELFLCEVNLDWYVTLGEKLHEEYFPVWINLLKEVSRAIRDVVGQKVMETKFRATTSHKDVMLGMLKAGD